jgi:hypothetical protein
LRNLAMTKKIKITSRKKRGKKQPLAVLSNYVNLLH